VCLACEWIGHELGEGRNGRHALRDCAMIEMIANRTDKALEFPNLETPGLVGGQRLLCGEGATTTSTTGDVEKYCSKDFGCMGRKGAHMGDIDIQYLAKAIHVNITVLHVWHQGTTKESVKAKQHSGGEGASTNIILARTGGYQGAAFGHYEPVFNKTKFKGCETMTFAAALKLLSWPRNDESAPNANRGRRAKRVRQGEEARG
jgi:hypothetical protein